MTFQHLKNTVLREGLLLEACVFAVDVQCMQGSSANIGDYYVSVFTA